MRGATRRKSDRGEKDFRAMRAGISWEVVAIGALALIATLGGYVWTSERTSNDVKFTQLAADVSKGKEQNTQRDVDAAVTKKNVENIEKSVDEVKKQQAEQGRDLKEILRQLQNQQNQQRPPAR